MRRDARTQKTLYVRHFVLPRSGARLRARSRASRSAVRFLAAASDAFLARADLSAGVELRAAFLPPCLPNSRAMVAIAARTSAGILMLMLSAYI